MMDPNRTPAYTCCHHKWDRWYQYSNPIYESSCDLSDRMGSCHYRDAARCPNYQRLSDEKLRAIMNDKAVKGKRNL